MQSDIFLSRKKMIKTSSLQHIHCCYNLSLNLVKTGKQTVNCHCPRLITETWTGGLLYLDNPYVYFQTGQLTLWQQHSLTAAALNLHFVLTDS